jgi:hypothetical protein
MPTFTIQAVEAPRPSQDELRVLDSARHRLDPSQLQEVLRTLFQVSRFPLWSAPVPHAIRALDEHGSEVLRWDDWTEMKAVQEENRRKIEEANRLWSDDA